MTIRIISEPSCDRAVRAQIIFAKKMEASLLDALRACHPNLVDKKSKIEAHANQGGIGHVFDIINKDGTRHILKLVREQSIEPHEKSVLVRFQKELWISKQEWDGARPPKVYALGEIFLDFPEANAFYAFILQEYSPYSPAYEGLKSKRDILRFVEDVGRLSNRIHSISVPGFGESFDPENGRFTIPTWTEYIDRVSNRVSWQESIFETKLNATEKSSIRSRLIDLRNREFEPSLFHGDCVANWGNLLVDVNSREIKTVIDWEYSGGGDALVVDLATSICTLFERRMDNEFIDSFVNNFLYGYGLSEKTYKKYHKQDVETFAAICAINKILEHSNNNSHSDRKQALERLIRCIAGNSALGG